MVSLSEKAEQIRQCELRRAMGKLPDLKEEERRVIEHMTHMLVRKMLREPMTYLHEHAGTEKESAGKSAVETLFSLDIGKGKAVER